MTTNTRLTTEEPSHFYYPDGRPCYEVPRANGNGMRPTTLADCKRLGLLPSATTILKAAAKPQLTNWLIEQAVLSVLTTPRNDGEDLGAFVERVLHQERQQDQERQQAADRGTQLHASLEAMLKGEPVPDADVPWIKPAFEHLLKMCPKTLETEFVVIGQGYAGRVDFAGHSPESMWLVDFKTTKKLPKDRSWPEHRLQLSAYAEAFMYERVALPLSVANLYISTTDQGAFVWHENHDWPIDFRCGFFPLLQYWKWLNSY